MEFISITKPIEKIEEVQDVIILGGGPAGLTAGIYTGRNLWRTLIIEKGILGGKYGYVFFLRFFYYLRTKISVKEIYPIYREKNRIKIKDFKKF